MASSRTIKEVARVVPGRKVWGLSLCISEGKQTAAEDEILTICQDACYDHGNFNLIQSVRCSA